MIDVERTATIVADTLDSLGLDVRHDVDKTGVIANLDITSSGKRVALRAAMDALLIQEENSLL